MRDQTLIDQGTGTVEVHTQSKKKLKTIERKESIRNNPLIHGALIISVMNVMLVN